MVAVRVGFVPYVTVIVPLVAPVSAVHGTGDAPSVHWVSEFEGVKVEDGVRSWSVPLEVPSATKFCGTLIVAFQVIVAPQLDVAPNVPSQTWKLVTLVRSTVAVVVPVMAPEAAVMVAVPWETPLSSPPVVMVAVVVSELDQQTVFPLQLVPPVNVPVLPS
jgi:hypothetical protein